MHSSIREQSHSRIVRWFRGGLAFKAHRRLYHSTIGSIVKTKKEKSQLALIKVNWRVDFRRGQVRGRCGKLLPQELTEARDAALRFEASLHDLVQVSLCLSFSLSLSFSFSLSLSLSHTHTLAQTLAHTHTHTHTHTRSHTHTHTHTHTHIPI